MCNCNCWALLNEGNYTLDELRVVLLPVTNKLRKELLVDKKTLSAYINKRISKQDNRQSSQQIGVGGILFLTILTCAIILADLTSLPIFLAESKKYSSYKL
jgi:hypothetical protein